MVESRIPYETVKAIARAAQQAVDDEVLKIKSQIQTAVTTLDNIQSSKKVESDILREYATAP